MESYWIGQEILSRLLLYKLPVYIDEYVLRGLFDKWYIK